MKRYYYIANELDSIEQAERGLENSGFSHLQLHVLSDNDAEVEKRHLNDVDSISKKDVIASTLMGAGLGIIGAGMVIGIAVMMGVTGQASWAPVLFLAVCLLGFCTWEGGLFGIQTPNRQFKRFEKALSAGKHVFFADVDDSQKMAFFQVMSEFPQLESAGSGKAEMEWLLSMRQNARRFVQWAP